MRTLCRPIAVLLSALLVLGPALDAQIPANGSSSDQGIQELHLRVVEGGGAEYKLGSLSDKSLVVAVTDQEGAPVPSVAVLFRLPDEGATGAFTDGSRATIAYSDMQGRATVRNIQWGSTPGSVVVRITATKGIAHAGVLAAEMLTAGGGRSKQVKATAKNQSPSTKPAPVKPMAAVHGPTSTTLTPPAPEQSVDATPHAAEPPAVSITTDSKGSAHSGSKKWLWIALIGAGAAVGAFAASGGSHSSANSGAPASSTIGNPSVSIGRP